MARNPTTKVTLYIPGLFHFIPEFEEDELKDLLSLCSLLSFGRARAITEKLYLDQLADFFSLTSSPLNDIPYAALCRLTDDASRPEGSWMRVDPVHLKPSPKGLTLIDSRQFSISQHDALALAACVGEEFKQANCELEVPVPDCWYLRLPNTPHIKTQPVHHVAGQSISDFMLTGEHADSWLRLFNQVQMLLHDSEVNKQRQARGEPEINSLWFWGVGELPANLDRVWSRVFSDDKIVKGLCMLSSGEYYALEEFNELNQDEQLTGDNLFVISDALQSVQYDEPLGWLESVRLIESEWLSPILHMLKQGQISQLEVYTDAYQLQLHKSALKRFWKRRKKLKSFFE